MKTIERLSILIVFALFISLLFKINVATANGISMIPTINNGEKYLYYMTDNASLDDIIIYRTVIDGEEIYVVHRVIAVSNDGTRYYTKGDNNEWIDSVTVTKDDIVGVYVCGIN